MKNNKTLKIACGLLVMVLLTTCVISTTLARYTTSDTASDTARVAKWGVEVSTSGTLFGNSYTDNIVAVNDAGLSVQSYNQTDDIVAPGTQNSTGFQIKLSGQPEVDFKVEASAANVRDIYLAAGNYGSMVLQTGLNHSSVVEGLYTLTGNTYTKVAAGTAWDPGTAYYKLHDYVEVATDYYPIAWCGKLVQGTNTYETNYTSLNNAVNGDGASIYGVVDYINGYNTLGGTESVYQTNHILNDTYTITWAWAIDGQNNLADTTLGNLIAGKTNVVSVAAGGTSATALVIANNYVYVGTVNETNLTGSLEVRCDITVTATQVD